MGAWHENGTTLEDLDVVVSQKARQVFIGLSRTLLHTMMICLVNDSVSKNSSENCLERIPSPGEQRHSLYSLLCRTPSPMKPLKDSNLN